MDLEDDSLILFYNNGSGPAPQASRMFLGSPGSSSPISDQDLNQDGSVTIGDAIIVLNYILNDNNVVDADINFDTYESIFDLIILIL